VTGRIISGITFYFSYRNTFPEPAVKKNLFVDRTTWSRFIKKYFLDKAFGPKACVESIDIFIIVALFQSRPDTLCVLKNDSIVCIEYVTAHGLVVNSQAKGNHMLTPQNNHQSPREFSRLLGLVVRIEIPRLQCHHDSSVSSVRITGQFPSPSNIKLAGSIRHGQLARSL
jgi:hypothetical protein